MFSLRLNCNLVVKKIVTRGFHVTPIVQSEYDKLFTQPVTRWSALDRFKEKFGLYRYARPTMKDSSVYLYLSVTDDLPIVNFMNHCQLPDTYFSWFLVTQLHVWMIMVKCNAAGSDGKYIAREFVARLWEDAHERMKRLGRFDVKTQNEVLNTLYATFIASLLGLDEGLLSDDKVLAAALWRHFFTFSDVDPVILEMMVSYVRVQTLHISKLNNDYLLSRGRVIWKPFDPLIRKEDLPKLKVVTK
ncbi:ubiquinol-cytochrome-c reductase complex assembly factor 1-like [Panonychus citri]|uniref:ubiquinol-cytochrome-c reductase complex assembly factor 1-like n=1 Tax=Panonychus citri TaxID=50023 RepID=UPI0023082B72|nr:ubiquinol-cytochrome-c reductase complex assembly factor 1-like [Panonychus citri]